MPTARRNIALVDGKPMQRQCIYRFHRSDDPNDQGERCTNIPIPGGYLCKSHGGGRKMIRDEAKKRLFEMCEPAFAVLNEVLEDELADPEVRVKAAFGVLDRAGFGPKATMVLEDRRSELADMTDEELAHEAEKLARAMKHNATHVIDATVEDAGGGSIN